MTRRNFVLSASALAIGACVTDKGKDEPPEFAGKKGDPVPDAWSVDFGNGPVAAASDLAVKGDGLSSVVLVRRLLIHGDDWERVEREFGGFSRGVLVLRRGDATYSFRGVLVLSRGPGLFFEKEGRSWGVIQDVKFAASFAEAVA